MKKFNVTGTCIPEKHYMVDITNKLMQIKEMVDDEAYFTINRGRQYGKTTTLSRLRHFLADEYTVIAISFEGLDEEEFANAKKFSQTFLKRVYRALGFSNLNEKKREAWKNEAVVDFESLSEHITEMCENNKYVLMIDEVDKASNNRVFLGFLSKLREKFLARADEMDFTFHSVILAGVYDIKNIKLKMINEGLHEPLAVERRMYNSPWNIASDFKVDMSFSIEDIKTMLTDYEAVHQMEMDITKVATEIHFYTNGYPVLVSRICKYLDESLKNWNQLSVREAVRLLVNEIENPLFRGLSQNLEANTEVYKLLYDVLILGLRRSFSTDNPAVDLAYRYGYIKEVRGRVQINNRVFEVRMADYFISKDELKRSDISSGSWFADMTRGGRFNMEMCLERFRAHWKEIYTEKESRFTENQCRMIFLTYLKPLLNGVGFAHIETALADDRRMDLVITYGTERFILELKTWKGDAYNQEGVEQLLGYVDNYNENKGYLLTFDFRKKPEQHKPVWTVYGNREIFEVRVNKNVEEGERS